MGLHWDASQTRSTEEMIACLDDALLLQPPPPTSPTAFSSTKSGSNITTTTTGTEEGSREPLRIILVAVFTGMGYHGRLQDTTIAKSAATLRRMLAVNCEGPALLCQHLAIRIHTQTSSSTLSTASPSTSVFPPPVMLVLSSYSGLIGLPYRAAYCSSKFALNGFLESLHAEFRKSIRLVIVCPTSVSTAFRSNWQKKDADESERNNKRNNNSNNKNNNNNNQPSTPASTTVMNEADMTPDECVSGIWKAMINAARNTHHTGIEFIVMPNKPFTWKDWKIVNAVWGCRLQYFGFDQWTRGLVLRKAGAEKSGSSSSDSPPPTRQSKL